tara:strand:- start:817 stop:1743 length:927 start_codon:yes stop_codon:yes gene_type:complete
MAKTLSAMLLCLTLLFAACSETASTTQLQETQKANNQSKEVNQKVETDSATPASVSTNTIDVNGISRTYLTYMPETASDSMPVIIQFHGGSGTAQDAYFSSNFDATADEEGVLMVYPQAETSSGSVWNTIHASEGNKVSSDDFGFIEALINHLSNDSRIDTSRVYVAGYSNGAAMAYQIACHLNDQIAGFAVMSGNFPLEADYPCNITHETGGLIFNGTDDDTRPLEGIPGYAIPVREGAEWWADQNNSIREQTIQEGNVERTTYVTLSGTEIQLFIINGGGHVWFNFNVDGMPMNTFIWKFLSQYQT